MNISRSKALFKKPSNLPRIRKEIKNPNCSHCGGAYKCNGDITACIMCSRELGHTCNNCSYLVSDS